MRARLQGGFARSAVRFRARAHAAFGAAPGRPLWAPTALMSVRPSSFAETKDQIGGVALAECADLDDATDVASRHPAAHDGMIGVRPVRER